VLCENQSFLTVVTHGQYWPTPTSTVRNMDEEVHWDREADNWVRLARTPDHDAYWQYRGAFFEVIVPAPGRRTVERDTSLNLAREHELARLGESSRPAGAEARVDEVMAAARGRSVGSVPEPPARSPAARSGPNRGPLVLL
jgi:hypothetical protein